MHADSGFLVQFAGNRFFQRLTGLDEPCKG